MSKVLSYIPSWAIMLGVMIDTEDLNDNQITVEVVWVHQNYSAVFEKGLLKAGLIDQLHFKPSDFLEGDSIHNWISDDSDIFLFDGWLPFGFKSGTPVMSTLNKRYSSEHNFLDYPYRSIEECDGYALSVLEGHQMAMQDNPAQLSLI